MTSQTGITIGKDGKKRMTVTPLTPIGAPTPNITTNKEGKKKMVVEPIPKTTTAGPSMCPPGCVTEQVCQQRIVDALKEHGNLPAASKGQEHYQDYLDKMEEAYMKMGPVDEDEDILFDKSGFKKSKSKSKKKSKKSNDSKKITGCEKYSNKPLKCLVKGCKYSDKTKKCTGSPAPKKLKPERKNRRVVNDGEYGDFAFAMGEEIQRLDSSIPFAPAIPLQPITAGQPKVTPIPSSPRSPKAKKVPSPKRISPTTAYRNARKRAIDNDQLQFTIDGHKFSRKSLTTKYFR
jgi:hypothetical protein